MEIFFGLLFFIGLPIFIIWAVVNNRKSTKKLLQKRQERISKLKENDTSKNTETKTGTKKQYLVDDFEIIVTGIFYDSYITGESRQNLIRDLEIYEPVFFKADPENEFDKKAVLVLNSLDEDLGYVKSTETHLLHPFLTDKYIIEALIIKKHKARGGHTIILNVTIREFRNAN